MQILPNIENEYDRLHKVVVGVARNMGGVPEIEACYDARSRVSVEQGIYPSEEECMTEVKGLIEALESFDVEVLRPASIPSLNQVFARDIAFVIEDQFILPNVIEDRAAEANAIAEIEERIPSSNIIMMPSGCFAEGGDVLVHNHHVFVGVSDDSTFERFKTARTNYAGMEYLADEFPAKEFKGFELLKSDVDPYAGSLHLDCAFQPIGGGKAIVAPHLFKNQQDVDWIMDFFGPASVYTCTPEEAFELTTNVFSVSATQIIVADTFTGLIKWLEDQQMEVKQVKYQEIVKMGGLLRCSTMPLIRE